MSAFVSTEFATDRARRAVQSLRLCSPCAQSRAHRDPGVRLVRSPTIRAASRAIRTAGSATATGEGTLDHGFLADLRRCGYSGRKTVEASTVDADGIVVSRRLAETVDGARRSPWQPAQRPSAVTSLDSPS